MKPVTITIQCEEEGVAPMLAGSIAAALTMRGFLDDPDVTIELTDGDYRRLEGSGRQIRLLARREDFECPPQLRWTAPLLQRIAELEAMNAEQVAMVRRAEAEVERAQGEIHAARQRRNAAEERIAELEQSPPREMPSLAESYAYVGAQIFGRSRGEEE